MKKLENQINTYIKDRLDNQFNWYDKKSIWNQKRYKNFKLATIILSVCIPFAVGFVDHAEWVKIMIGVAGILIAVFEGVSALNDYQQNYVGYRATAEALKREKLIYQAKALHYDEEEKKAFKILVERIEGILAGEQEDWKNYASTDKGVST